MADPVDDAPDLVEAELTPKQATAKLTQLKASATKEYSLKNYASAAELYSEATALQASISGEMAPSNADLLYAYGRALYHVAISKSDVLGGKVAGGGSSEEPKKKKRKVDNAETEKPAEQKTAEEVVEAVVEEKGNGTDKEVSKPFFQITGDENWTDSEDEGEDADGEDAADGEGEDEEDDDFANAYEVLDLARVLLTKQIDLLASDGDGKGKAVQPPDGVTGERRTIMERLADTLDLQAEIWLESERFSNAVPDFQKSLEIKRQIFPLESSLIAEAHYKLSLALEFASLRKVEQDGEATEAPAEPTTEVDEDMRKEAAGHMEEAIASCKLRVEKERTALNASSDATEKEKKTKNIKDVEEMIGEMEQRLVDLRNPAVTSTGGPAGAPADAEAIGGLLGSILGETPAQQKARIAEATKGANDLSGLIKKKKAPKHTTAADLTQPATSKRKLDAVPDEQGGANGKKAKIESEGSS